MRERVSYPRLLYNNSMFQRHFVQNQRMMFVTSNLSERKPLFANPTFANEVVLALYKTQQIHPFFLYGFVIMPDHCHVLLSVPEHGSVSKIMHTFKRSVSFALEQGSIWQSRFHIVYPKNSNEILTYIYQNPVRANLSNEPESYPWSSASGKYDVLQLPDPIIG